MVRRPGHSKKLGDETGYAITGIYDTSVRSADREVTFLHQSLEAILPRGEVSECNGQKFLIDKNRRPCDGDKVLVNMSGMWDWVRVILNPERIITDDGLILEGDLLDDVYVVGVATHEIVPAWEGERPTI